MAKNKLIVAKNKHLLLFMGIIFISLMICITLNLASAYEIGALSK